MSVSPVSETSTSEILQRRLVGLLVLLLFVFLLSMLLRGLAGRPTGTEAGLQTVVIPLSGNELPPVATAESPPPPSAEEAADEPVIEPAPAPEPAAAKPSKPMDAPPKATKPPATVAATPKPAPTRPVKPAVPPVTKPAPAAAARWFVVLGTFSDAANAKALALRARRAGFTAETVPMRTATGALTRVRAGPFKSESEGQGARATLIVEGMTNAKLVKEP